MSDAVRKLAEYIRGSDNIVFFGGAGVSTESGVPDFRSKDGLYNRPNVGFENYTPEYLLSHDCLTEHPEVFFEFYRQKMDTRNAEPNAAHHFLSDLERIGKLKAIVTQNIDGLHQRAGTVRSWRTPPMTTGNLPNCKPCGKKFSATIFMSSAKPRWQSISQNAR